MIEDLNEGIITGELMKVIKDRFTLKTGKTMIKYGIVLRKSREYKNMTYHKLAMIEYIRFEDSQQIETLPIGEQIKCEFKLESREWQSDGKIQYFTTAIGQGEIVRCQRQMNLTENNTEDNYDDIPF
jgi:hypothetical protein